MVKYISTELGLTATIDSVDHVTDTVVYTTDDGKTHAVKYEDFIKVFNGIINKMITY